MRYRFNFRFGSNLPNDTSGYVVVFTGRIFSVKKHNLPSGQGKAMFLRSYPMKLKYDTFVAHSYC